MKKLLALIAGAVLSLAPLSTQAAPILLNTHYGFGFSGTGSSIVGTQGGAFILCTNPACIDSPTGTNFEFTLASAGVLTVLDLFLSVDRFEIFDTTLGLLGQTSAPVAGGTCDDDFTCALADARYSRGIFNLAAGSYSIFGAQLEGQGGAGAFIVETASTIPVPAALPLLGLALGGLMTLRRRNRRDA